MMNHVHAWPLVLAATLACAGCTSSANAPSASQSAKPSLRLGIKTGIRAADSGADCRPGRSRSTSTRPISAPTSPTPTGR